MNSLSAAQILGLNIFSSSSNLTFGWTTSAISSTAQTSVGANLFRVNSESAVQTASTIPLSAYSSFEEACLQNRVEKEILLVNRIAGQLNFLRIDSVAVNNYIQTVKGTFLPFTGGASLKSPYALNHIAINLMAARVGLLDSINDYMSWLTLAKTIEPDADLLLVPPRFVVQAQEDEAAETVHVGTGSSRDEVRRLFEEV